MENERNLSDKQVSEKISEIKSIRTANTIRITSKGGMYVRPIDVIVSAPSRSVDASEPSNTKSNGTRHCD